MTPPHYQTPVSPWDLQTYMHSSGDAFVDARRCDAIKYVFRNKASLLSDLKKARHCLDAAISKLEGSTTAAETLKTSFQDTTLDGAAPFSFGTVVTNSPRLPT